MDDPRNEEFWKFKIATLNIEPGDVLVISFPTGTASETMSRAARIMSAMLPSGIKCVAKQDDQMLTVVTPGGSQTVGKNGEAGAFIRRQHSMSGTHAQQIIVDDPHEP